MPTAFRSLWRNVLSIAAAVLATIGAVMSEIVFLTDLFVYHSNG